MIILRRAETYISVFRYYLMFRTKRHLDFCQNIPPWSLVSGHLSERAGWEEDDQGIFGDASRWNWLTLKTSLRDPASALHSFIKHSNGEKKEDAFCPSFFLVRVLVENIIFLLLNNIKCPDKMPF